MKNCLIAVVFLLQFSTAFAQENADFSIALKMPTSVRSADQSHLERLKGKLGAVLQNSNMTVMSGGSEVMLISELSAGQEKKVDAGTKKLSAVELTLNLSVRDGEGKVVFGSTQLILRGSGGTYSQAVMQGINSLSVSDSKLRQFLENAKAEALRYYDSHCEQLLSKAQVFRQTGRWEDAISLLATVPQSSTCHAESRLAVLAMFKDYREHRCHQTMAAAKARLAANDYKGGLAILAQIDPESSCFAEAGRMVDSVAKEVDEETMRSWEALTMLAGNSVELEKYRWLGIQEWMRGIYGN